MPNYVAGVPEELNKRLIALSYKDGDCWRFKGCLSHNGYATVSYQTKKERVIRLILHFTVGMPLRSTLVARHKLICPHKDCWNPEHILHGTQKQNMEDYSKSVTHCPRGHEYTPHNTRRPKVIMGHGGRSCMECKKLQARERRARA
jgi:hypothetical protein